MYVKQFFGMILALIGWGVCIFFSYTNHLTPTVLGICLVFMACVFVLLAYSSLIDNREQKKQQAEIKKIFGTITQSFCDGMNMDETKLRRTYEENNLNESFESFADFLNKYLNTLFNERDDRISYGKNTENKDNKKSYDDIDDFLSPIIRREKAEKPFEGVEERARKLLQDIDKASKEQNPDAVSSSLKYLANIMIENQKINSKENRRNALLTRIGVIATIVGLVIAIIIFIIQNNRSLTGETIKQEMIEVIDSSVAIDTNNIVDYRLKYDNDAQTTSGQ